MSLLWSPFRMVKHELNLLFKEGGDGTAKSFSPTVRLISTPLARNNIHRAAHLHEPRIQRVREEPQFTRQSSIECQLRSRPESDVKCRGFRAWHELTLD